MTNSLPTVNIKGKEYVMAKDRIGALGTMIEAKAIKCYSITTEKEYISDLKMFIVKATLSYEDMDGNLSLFNGHSQAVLGSSEINRTSALENAETSAVARACAMAGIGIIESVASADEIKKVTSTMATKNESYTVNAVLQEPSVGSSTWNCKDCGAEMVWAVKTRKSDSKEYGAYFCPNENYKTEPDKHKMTGYVLYE